MSDDPKMSRNPDMIPTKELLKQQRKREYELAKKKRKEEKRDEKKQAAEEKAAARAKKDAALWGLLRRGSEIEQESRPDSEEDGNS